MAHIDIQPHAKPVTVTFNGETIVRTDKAVELHEGTYPMVLYFPRADAAMDKLTRTELTTRCPFKGTANYYSIDAGGEVGANLVWTYEDPIPEAEGIRGYLAFYPGKVEVTAG